MDAALVSGVRQFNRTVTQRIGALNDAYLSRGRPLGQARLLWEIGGEGSEVRTLRSRLGLDSGYASRLLRALQADGLIVVDAAGDDGRVRRVRLTAAGAAERAELDRLSDELAVSILRPLSSEQRTRLVAAMVEIDRLLVASAVHTAVVDPRHPDARRSLTAYVEELGRRFDDGFDPARSISADDDELTAPRGLLLTATLQGEAVGIGALKFHDGQWAEVKRMWVSPAVRGMGLGRRILVELEAHARQRGVRLLRLETNRALAEAIALYRKAGFGEVQAFSGEPYAHHWFEKVLDQP
jgi:DNA-binding MarR family transcriptional regulator/GNAT superfamily N-acetyltransferase